MFRVASKVSEFRRFPFWGTLLGGIFLLFIIRLYWDPSIATNVVKDNRKEVWGNTQYSVWGPIWKYGFDRIGKGEIPHWNPYQLCGQPYLVDIRTALFQPLHLLFWRMEFAYAYQWYIFLSLSLLGMGFLIWGRILEIPYPALIPGIISLLFSGPVLCAQMSLPILSGSVWILFLLSGMVYFIETPSARSSLILLFIWTALILSGSIECIFTGSIMLIFFPFVFRSFPMLAMEKKSLTIIFKVIFILILGLMISAFTWVPFLIWLIDSGQHWGQFISFPLSAHFPETFYLSIFQFFLPMVSWDLRELPIFYPGLISFIFIIPAFFDRELRSIVLFHVCILLFFFLLFFVNLDYARILQKGMLILVSISFSTLSGIGFYRLLLKGRDISSPYVRISGILVLLLLIALILISNPWTKGISILLFIILVPAILIRIRKINSVLCVFIALLSFIELYYLLRPFLPESYIPVIESKDAFTEFTRQLRYQTGTGKGFILSEPGTILWSENLGMYYHWQLANGEILPKDKYSQRWIDSLVKNKKEKLQLLKNPLLTISGVQWVFIPTVQRNNTDEKELKNWRKMEQVPFVEVYENTQPVPRCFWIGKYKNVSTFEEVMDILIHGNFSPFTECIIQTDTAIPINKKVTETLRSSSQESIEVSENIVTASIQEENPESISIQVKATKAGFLVLLDTYCLGWQAFIDGEQTQIFRANGIFKGVPIPGGVHQVTFQYTSPGWHIGKILTLTSLLLTFIFIIGEYFYKEKGNT